MFGARDDIEQTRKDLCWLLEGLVQRNQDYLRQRPDTPRLYKSGVVYEAPKQFAGECEETHILRQALGVNANLPNVSRVLDLVQAVFGGEHFCDIGVIRELGAIDCDGLSSWRVAELRQHGIHARPFLTYRERLGGGTTYHALVRWPPFGSIPYATTEDPSLLLGMGGPARAAERAEEIRKNVERCDELRKHGIGPGLYNEIEDVLGIRRQPERGGMDQLVAEIDNLLRRAA